MARVQKTVEAESKMGAAEEEIAAEPVQSFPEGTPEAHQAAILNAQTMADAINLRPEGEKNPPKPTNKQFRVLNYEPVRVMVGGYVAMMKQGKVIDSTCYDIESLKSQGVNLEEMG